MAEVTRPGPYAVGSPIPKDEVIKLLDGFGAKGDTSNRVYAEMWALGWQIIQGPIPKMRIE